jgi:hypothetical protein
MDLRPDQHRDHGRPADRHQRPLASYDGIVLWKDEASMAINFETSIAGTQNTATALATSVTNTWTRVGFYFDGTATTGT